MRAISMARRERERERERGKAGGEADEIRSSPFLFASLGASRAYNAHACSNCRWVGTAGRGRRNGTGGGRERERKRESEWE